MLDQRVRNSANSLPCMLTKYQDVNDFVEYFVAGIVPALEGNIVGIYLTGSLSYQAFNHHSSDIDLTVIVRRPVSRNELESLGRFHAELVSNFEKWAAQFECSYTPIEMLPGLSPPRDPRPWYWGGTDTLYPEAPFGNQWLINNYLLYEHGIALLGPSYPEIGSPVDVGEVQKACIRDLFTEWLPKRSDAEWFRISHHQAYFVLNLCRILHTAICGAVGSKQAAASWVKNSCGAGWKNLIDTAQRWEYGIELCLQPQALSFLDFAVSEASQTPLSTQLADEL